MVTLGVRRCFRICPRDGANQESQHSEPVAQLVEHRTFNAVVAGSIPARLTILTALFSILYGGVGGTCTGFVRVSEVRLLGLLRGD